MVLPDIQKTSFTPSLVETDKPPEQERDNEQSPSTPSDSNSVPVATVRYKNDRVNVFRNMLGGGTELPAAQKSTSEAITSEKVEVKKKPNAYQFLQSALRSDKHVDKLRSGLKKAKVDINQPLPERRGETLLHFGAANGTPLNVQVLLTHPQIDPNRTMEYDMTALHYAVQRARDEGGSTNMIDVLKDHIDCSIRDDKNETALDLAKRYLTKGAPLEQVIDTLEKAQDKQVRTRELHQAVSEGDLEGVKKLLSATAYMGDMPDTQQRTVLHAAVLAQQLDMADYLIHHPFVGVNAQDRQGNMALHHAVSTGNLAMVERLLSAPDINAQPLNKAGVTPRELALELGHEAIAKRLHEAELYFPICEPTEKMRQDIPNMVAFRGKANPIPTGGVLRGVALYVAGYEQGDPLLYPMARSEKLGNGSYKENLKNGWNYEPPKEHIQERMAAPKIDLDKMRGCYSVNGEARAPVYSDNKWEVHALGNGRFMIGQPVDAGCSYACESMLLMDHGLLTESMLRDQGLPVLQKSHYNRSNEAILASLKKRSAKEPMLEPVRFEKEGDNSAQIRALAEKIKQHGPCMLIRPGSDVMLDEISDDLKTYTVRNPYHQTYSKIRASDEFWNSYGQSHVYNGIFTVQAIFLPKSDVEKKL